MTKTGILLVNLGTPDAPTPKAVRRYLAEFLSDRRIVDYPRIFWLPLLYGIILPFRAGRTARNYEKIWCKDNNESPLRRYTRAQAQKLANRFKGNDSITIDWAMRYGQPSVQEKLREMRQQECKKILILPLYPQYSTTTSLSVEDASMNAFKALAWKPEIRFAQPFYQDPAYITALTAITKAHLATLDKTPEQVIISFHGIPERLVTNGDPYAEHCTGTASALRDAVGWDEAFAPLGFQSKFGREKWLEPSAEEIVIKAASEGKKNIAIITPAFVSDCIETLEEVAIGLNEVFKENGGETLTLIPCLNDSSEMIALLESLIKQNCSDWLKAN
jgi:protoporphyrin/coproporphyrin ferrochelatase